MAGLRGLTTGHVAARTGATLPEIASERVVLRLARPGMEGPLAEFLATNFPGHLDRWSPPVGAGFFTEAFWREKLRLAVEEFHTDRAVRLVLQLRQKGDARLPIDARSNTTRLRVVGTDEITRGLSLQILCRSPAQRGVSFQ